MDWIHCNACFYQPGQPPKRDFKLTSCGHIFCQYCEQSATIEQCKVCSVQCTTTPLTSQMAHEIRCYFEDPESVQGKILKAMEFQKGHRKRLTENFIKVLGKYHNLKVEYIKMNEELKKTKNELANYKRQQSMSALMTPPQPKVQYPLFSKNSPASQAISRGMSPWSPIGVRTPNFMTPSTVHQYRVQNSTPSTPLSNGSSYSPASVSSFKQVRNLTPSTPLSSASSYSSASASSFKQMSQPSRPVSSQQSPYGPGLTPPMNRMGSLKNRMSQQRGPVSSQQERGEVGEAPVASVHV